MNSLIAHPALPDASVMDRIAARLKREYRAERVILYGSVARGEATEDPPGRHSPLMGRPGEANLSEWRRVARQDWHRVKVLLADGDGEGAGFFLQQAVEKFVRGFRPAP
jgi:hypothetical protein